MGPLLQLCSEPAPKGAAKDRVHLDVRLDPGDDADAVTPGIASVAAASWTPGWGELPWRVYADLSGNELCLPPGG